MSEGRRRTLLSFSVFALGAGILFAAWCWWTAPGGGEEGDIPPRLRQVLEWNSRLWASPPSHRLSVLKPEPPAGKIPRTNGDLGLKNVVDVNLWRLEVYSDDSADARHLQLSLAELRALPRTTFSTEFRCVEGWSEDMSFAGIKFTDFMKAYGLQSKKYVALVSVDGEYYVSIDMESMEHEQTLLAYEMNGKPLLHQNGAPLRLVIPIKYGIKNLKQIGKIYFSDTRPPDYWAEQGYDWFAGL